MEEKANHKMHISKHKNDQADPQVRIPRNTTLTCFHIAQRKFASGIRSTTNKASWENNEKICLHHHWALQEYWFP